MKHSFLFLIGIVAHGLVSFSPSAAAALPSETIRNLNAAYRGESNAAHRYKLFAEAAEKEGYAQVAKLFRAASKAEEIHRETHKKTIATLGGKVDSFPLDAVNVKSTAENLRAALQGESYEWDTMYPKFLKTAEEENAREALRSFRFAMAAETEHAKLYQAALDTLGKIFSEDYYVCQVCGMTVSVLPEKKCSSCRKGVEKYIKVD
ncbi:MAG: rubrerythrin family protein [Candidatus Methylacidiphilales bacterium]